MRIRTAVTLAAFVVFGAAHSQPNGPDLSGAHDGRWAVVLVCADTHDRNGLVKGYKFEFIATIAGGRLEGRYGGKEAPASLIYTGQVQADGTLDISAVGNTGSPDFTVGKVAQGTPYAYTLHGRLGATTGEAVRRELRPCTATFTKQ